MKFVKRVKEGVVIACILASGASLAQEEVQEPGVGSLEELEGFIDGAMAALLDDHNIAGATVSVVKEGRLFFAKGYGYADVETKTKVDAESTMFRIGSVSKLFVWTAVMQLYEKGLIDLDADINDYLTEFQIPDTYEDPITLKHLMAHTPGFEDVAIELFAHNEAKLLPLEEVLERQLPMRVRPPGVYSSYSNHGTAMAARIVENISGMSWDEYVERNIFERLQMKHTTFRQPVPSTMPGSISNGYSNKGGAFVSEDFEFVTIPPAGSVSATATDMAKFMIAHLELGSYGLVRILEEETAREMQRTHFSHHPEIDGMAHGFWAMEKNGYRVIGHGGDTLLFHSNLVILPDHETGLFVSFNSVKGVHAKSKILDLFMDRYFPGPEVGVPALAVKGADKLVGAYRGNRMSHSTFLKAGGFSALKVSVNDDNHLVLSSHPGIEWGATEQDGLFRETDGERTIAFRMGDDGKAEALFLGSVPVMAFERPERMASPVLHQIAFLSACALILSALAIWPLGAIIRVRLRVIPDNRTLLPTYARVTSWIACALMLAFIGGVALSMRAENSGDVVFGVTDSVKYALYIPLLALFPISGVVICTMIAWGRMEGTHVRRTYYSLVAAALVLLLAQLDYWNLLGHQYRASLLDDVSDHYYTDELEVGAEETIPEDDANSVEVSEPTV